MPEASDTITSLPVAPAATAIADTAAFGAISPRSAVCTILDAPQAVGAERVTTGRVAFTGGCEPVPRAELPGYDSGVMTLVTVTFLLLSLNFKHYSTFLKTFAEDLWNVNRRRFQGVHTVSEMRILMSLVLLNCVCQGILLFSAIGFTTGLFRALTGCVVVTGAYYAWQLLAYNTVGFAFGDDSTREQWLKGFNASQSLLGLTLVVPALVSLFFPGVSMEMVSIAILLYATARIVFISKGFRLFYENFYSLVYFILYLCTLEIAPLFLLFKICTLLQAQDLI